MIISANFVIEETHSSTTGNVVAIRIGWTYDNKSGLFYTSDKVSTWINGFHVHVDIDDVPGFCSQNMKLTSIGAVESASKDLVGAIWCQVFDLDPDDFDEDTDEEEDEGFRW